MTETNESSVPTIKCRRCQRQAAPATGVFYGGAIGERIRTEICGDCWAEWQNYEVIVINELKLNFMDPKSQEILAEQMREFLVLNDGPSDG